MGVLFALPVIFSFGIGCVFFSLSLKVKYDKQKIVYHFLPSESESAFVASKWIGSVEF